MMVEKNLPSCGKSRFGCWVCTMVEKDKSMEAMIANDSDKAWMTPLLEFRNDFGDENQDRYRRSFRKMGGHLEGSYGRLHHGPYKKEVREQWLKRLLEMQRGININGPEEFSDLELISIPELQNIRRIWVFDKHEFDDVLPQIYESVMNKPFPDPEWVSSEMFRKTEWDILKSVCDELYHDEELAFEMLYSLIDIENHSNSLNRRKGILNELESCISHHIYKNEEDATKFYSDLIIRKRNLGGKYNQKFLDNIDTGSDEFDDIAEEEE